MKDDLRLLPHSLESERAVLGAILLEQTYLYSAMEVMDRDDFYLEAHRIVYAAMLDLHAREIGIDARTLIDELKRTGKLDSAGGAPHIVALTDAMPRGINVKHYAAEVKEQAVRRRVIKLASDTMELAFQAEKPSKDVIQSLQLDLLKLSATRKGVWIKADALMDRAYKDIELLATRKTDVVGMDTGFSELNRLTQGFHPGQLVLIAGRPGHGKTSLAMNMIGNAILRHNRKVALFTIEMTGLECAKRLLYSESDVDSYRAGSGYLTKEDWVRLGEAAGKISATQLWVDESRVTIAEVRSRSHQLAIEGGLDLVVVDYLQLMKGSGRWKDNRVQEISEISAELKGLAKDLQIPVIALSQLNRSVETTNRKPQLSDLRESGSLEQDADLVLFVWREELRRQTIDNRGSAELIIGKQRNGPLDTIELTFLKQFCKFGEVAHAQEPTLSYQD